MTEGRKELITGMGMRVLRVEHMEITNGKVIILVIGTPMTEADIDRALSIYGKPVGLIKGKHTRSKLKSVVPVRNDEY